MSHVLGRLVRQWRRGKRRALVDIVAMRGVALAVNVGTGLLTAALLGPEGRGVQAALTLGPLFLAAVAPLGLHASLIYNVRADARNEPAYLGAGLLLALLAGVVATLVGWLLAPWWLSQYDETVVSAARLFLMMTPLGVMAVVLTGALEARGRFQSVNRLLYLQSLATLALLLILWQLDRLTPITAAAAYIAPWLPADLYLLVAAVRLIRPRLTLRPPFPRRLMGYGVRFCGVDMLSTLTTYLDQLIIVVLLEPAAVGIYVVALSLARVLTVLQGAVSTVLFPSIAARPMTDVVERVAATARLASLIVGLAALGIALVAPAGLRLVYGPAFAGALAPLLLLLPETVVTSTTRLLYQAFSGTGRPGIVTAFEALGVATSLAAMLLLVPAFGVVGAAGSLLLASIVRLACVLICLPLVLQVRMPRLILSRADLHWATGR